MDKKPFTVVSMYTIDTPYEEESKNLTRSLEKFEVPYKMYAIPNLGSWEKNCQEKSKVIRKALDEFDTNIVWIDADAVLIQEPVFFYTVTGDISVYRTFRTDKGGRHDVLSGTVFFSNTDKVRALVDKWIEVNSTNNDFDQLNLKRVIDADPNINVTPLPKPYIKIMPAPTSGAVIMHYQASRRFKEIVRK